MEETGSGNVLTITIMPYNFNDTPEGKVLQLGQLQAGDFMIDVYSDGSINVTSTIQIGPIKVRLNGLFQAKIEHDVPDNFKTHHTNGNDTEHLY